MRRRIRSCDVVAVLFSSLSLNDVLAMLQYRPDGFEKEIEQHYTWELTRDEYHLIFDAQMTIINKSSQQPSFWNLAFWKPARVNTLIELQWRIINGSLVPPILYQIFSVYYFYVIPRCGTILPPKQQRCTTNEHPVSNRSVHPLFYACIVSGTVASNSNRHSSSIPGT